MELIVELVIQVVGEILFEGALEGLGWTLRRRWGRVTLAVIAGFTGGVVWSTAAGHDGPPLLATALVGIQGAAIPLLTGRRIAGRTVGRGIQTDLVLIGAAVVLGRWVGWAS